MRLAFVQTLYRARGIPEFTQISIHSAMRNCCSRGSLQASPRRCGFCTTQGLHFQALQPFSFLFIRTFHWCKHCTWLEVFPNLRKFPFTALCKITAGVVVCRTVLDGAPLASAQGFHFQALQSISFLFICKLLWCKHCT